MNNSGSLHRELIYEIMALFNNNTNNSSSTIQDTPDALREPGQGIWGWDKKEQIKEKREENNNRKRKQKK